MIELKKYKEFWEMVTEKIEELSEVIPTTVDEDVAKKIKALKQDSATLFWIPPSAIGKGKNVDSYHERNQCIVFVMQKYDPARKDSLTVLEETQPIIEKIKDFIMTIGRVSCSPWILEDMQLNTMPETKFFANFAGWSVGFSIIC